MTLTGLEDVGLCCDSDSVVTMAVTGLEDVGQCCDSDSGRLVSCGSVL